MDSVRKIAVGRLFTLTKVSFWHCSRISWTEWKNKFVFPFSDIIVDTGLSRILNQLLYLVYEFTSSTKNLFKTSLSLWSAFCSITRFSPYFCWRPSVTSFLTDLFVLPRGLSKRDLLSRSLFLLISFTKLPRLSGFCSTSYTPD